MRLLVPLCFWILLMPRAGVASGIHRTFLPVDTRGETRIGVNRAHWATALTVRNDNETDVALGPCGAPGFPGNPSSPCIPGFNVLPKLSTLRNPTVGWTLAGDHGRFIYVTSDMAPRIHYSLRLLLNERPVTTLPVVTDEAFGERIHVSDVPIEAPSRISIRVYGLKNHPAAIIMHCYQSSTSLVDETLVATVHGQLTPTPFVDPSGYPYAPSYWETAIQELVGASSGVRLRLEIHTSDPGERLWALVTVVDEYRDAVIAIPSR